MVIDIIAGYRATMFDGEAELNWLRQGWRALRLYARKAKAAILDDDMALKWEMITRADQLLVLMTGILDTAPGTTLGPKLMNIYGVLQATLLRANLRNDMRRWTNSTAPLKIWFGICLKRLNPGVPHDQQHQCPWPKPGHAGHRRAG